MIKIGNFAQIAPEQIFVFLVGLVFLSIFVTFIIPLFLKSDKLRFNFTYFTKRLGKHPVWSVSAVVFVVVILGGTYIWYLSTLPQVVSADSFKKTEDAQLVFIEKSTVYQLTQNGGLFLVDTRPKEEFYKGHVQNSLNIPVTELENSRLLVFLKGKKVALYGSKDDLDEVKKAANELRKTLETEKIYVIEGGHESLVDSGFSVYAGDSFESLPIGK
ncbi:MAG: rhodanese-like domain-containing protein [Candidatus Woykebacteria bacterium]